MTLSGIQGYANTSSTYKKTLLDLIYPVGSFYWSTKSTSPATLFGGTWTQVKEAFVYASTSFNSKIQGEKTHTLTTYEMPAHHHRIYLYHRGYEYKEDGFWTVDGYDPALGYKDSAKEGSNAQTIEDTGGNKAHNNMPPYITAYCWYRTA